VAILPLFSTAFRTLTPMAKTGWPPLHEAFKFDRLRARLKCHSLGPLIFDRFSPVYRRQAKLKIAKASRPV